MASYMGDTVKKSACHYPKKFDLVPQTVSPCERVRCGEETMVAWEED